ncbi:MAG: PorV/PorQ family protein [bacterium]
MKRKVICGILGMLLIAGIGFAKEKGETSCSFLKLTGGARAAGMGDCYIGLSDDVSACYFNPAGLAQLETKEGLFMLLRPMTGVESLIMSFGAIAIPLQYGVFGGAFTYYGYGEMDKITGVGSSDNPVKDGKWSAYDFALSTSFAKNVKENLALGGSLKVINGKIDDESAIAFACDLGGLYKTPKKGLNVGCAIKNLGSNMKYDEDGFSLPLSLKAGVSYSLPKNLFILSDLTIPNDNDPYLGLGAEYSLKEMFFIRAGYKTGPEDEGKGFTIGLGTKYLSYNFDYAYQPFGKLGDSHRLSVKAKF